MVLEREKGGWGLDITASYRVSVGYFDEYSTERLGRIRKAMRKVMERKIVSAISLSA